MQRIKKQNTCSRGHVFRKTSTCPVCPKCWAGYYKKRLLSDFPKGIGAPALRALLNNRITKLTQLARYPEEEVARFHGIGPKAIRLLKQSLKARKLSFKR